MPELCWFEFDDAAIQPVLGSLGFSSAYSFQPHSPFQILAGHIWLNWRLLQHTDTAVNSQYASTWDLWPITSGDRNIQGTPQPKRMVSAWAWWYWGIYDVSWWSEAGSNPALWSELVCIATSDLEVNTTGGVTMYVGIVLVSCRLNLWCKPNSL